MNPVPPVALVTGGARRIGRAIVEDLVRHGFAVAIHYRVSHDEAAKLEADCIRAGGKVACVQGDLSDFAAIEKIVADAAKALGPLTLLVNNASIFEKDSAGTLEPGLWQRQMTVNLAAPVFLALAFARQLPDGVEGNIVNMLDQRVFRPSPRYFSYQISKSALHVATEMLALALAPRIRVNGIAPGPVLPSAHQTAEAFQQLAESTPLAHATGLGDFGSAVRFLVETKSITGQVIALDDGQHLGPKDA
jgi:NAD(P)-dependent dehydrogenase (short-subunit alcohol dehydrogenase family)